MNTKFIPLDQVISAASALFLSCGVGLLKMLPGKFENIGDQVPVDFVSNAIICISASMAKQNKVQSRIATFRALCYIL